MENKENIHKESSDEYQMNQSVEEENSEGVEEEKESDEEQVELTREEQLEKELEETKADYLRALADYENFRKRSQEELVKAKERAVSHFVQDILPSIDNFEMSLKMTENSQMFIRGVEMIHKNLLEVLTSHSISVYEPKVGEQFDVTHHDPVLVEHDEKSPGTILEVLSKGYKLKDTILRPARVQVSKQKEE